MSIHVKLLGEGFQQHLVCSDSFCFPRSYIHLKVISSLFSEIFFPSLIFHDFWLGQEPNPPFSQITSIHSIQMFLEHLKKIFSWVISFICLLTNLKDPCKQLKSMGNLCIMCSILISMLRSKLMSHLKPPKLPSLTSLWAAMFRFTLGVGILRKELQIFIYCPQTDAHPPSPFFLSSFSLQAGFVRSQAPTHIV